MTTLEEKIEHEINAIGVTQHAPQPSFRARMTAREMAAYIDHTVLKPDTTEAQVRQLCAEALELGFASVCVNATWVPLCVELVAGSAVKVCGVVGFALGATLPAVKAFEAQQVVELGAQEVDMVINVGMLKDKQFRLVHDDIAAVADECHEGGALLKVIIETGLLSDEEKIAACVIVREAGADFVKTSTGFNGGGATTADIALMRRIVGSELGVKASGGIRTATDALAMVAAGATRIGASAGVQILREMALPDGGARAATAVEPEESY